MFMFLGFRTQHINVGPLATRSGEPPPHHPGNHRKKLFMFTRRNPKGDGTETVINCRKLSQIVVTFYDEFYDEFYDGL